MMNPSVDAAKATGEIMELRNEVAQRILAETDARERAGHSEVVVGLLFFAIFGAVMGVVGTLLVEGIAWHWFF